MDDKDPSYDPLHPEECCPHCGARLERSDDGYCNRCGEDWPEKIAATGIPDRGDYGDLAKLRAGQLLDFIIQEHEAQRAGHHYDMRLGNPELGLYSWATRKELPEPGKRNAWFQQPLHAHGYGGFEGTLSGYGAGTVRRKRKGQILVTSADPEKIEFTTADERHPQRFVLLRSTSFKDHDWLLINTTPRQAVPYQKIHYTKIPAEEVESRLGQIQAGDSVQAKFDGAAALIKLLKDEVEVVSYRTAKETGYPIVHTERIFHGRPKVKIPAELVGSILRGELYGERAADGSRADQAAGQTAVADVGKGDRPAISFGGTAAGTSGGPKGLIMPLQGRHARPAGTSEGQKEPQVDDGAGEEHQGPLLSGSNGAGDVAAVQRGTAGISPFGTARAIGPQELGGLLNAGVARSIAKQREQGVRLRVMLHNIQQLGSQSISPADVGYNKRREMLQKILPHLPGNVFHLPEEAMDPESAQALWRSIAAGTHPYSSEGVVIHPSTGKPYKGKTTEEQDVHITGFFPGEGKYRGIGVGGFSYALEPGGPEVGRVGTGISDELRREFHADPHAFLGRTARVRSQGPFASGALRAPALVALHEDLPSKEAQVTADDVAAAAAQAHPDPTPAQKATGNYRKGHIWIQGLDVTIETAAGATRSGTDKDGVAWSVILVDPYGYIKRTLSEADKDHVDIFIGPHPQSELVVIINQNKPGTSTFDEHKTILGTRNEEEARELYHRNYSKGWKGYDSCCVLTMDQFKWWLKNGDTGQPIKNDAFAKAAATITHITIDILRNVGIVKDEPDEEPEHVPTVAVDLDGTIAEDGPFDAETIRPPREGAKETLEDFRDAGWRIIVFTVRGDRQRVEDYLEKHALPWDFINENPDQPADGSGKVIADLYLDDRSLDASVPWEELGRRAKTKMKDQLKKAGLDDWLGPFASRALRAQLYSPTWDMQRGVGANLTNNLHQGLERGRDFARQQMAVEQMQVAHNPQAALKRVHDLLFASQPQHPVDTILRGSW